MDTKDVEARVAAIRDWFANCANYKKEEDWKAVIGISGGKDSSVAAALLAKAIGPTKVFGVLMPNGEQKDIDDSYDLVRFLGINSGTVNIGGAFEALIDRLDVAWNDEGFFRSYGDDSRVTTNLPARLRMCTLYAVANHLNGRVIGTGNMSEKLTGYWTYGGDGLSDLAVLDDLYVSEVIELGEFLGLPERFTRKPPSDGMSGKTDEEKLGFSYDELEKAVRFLSWPAGMLDADRGHMIRDRVRAMRWKRDLIAGIPSVKDFMEEAKVKEDEKLETKKFNVKAVLEDLLMRCVSQEYVRVLTDTLLGDVFADVDASAGEDFNYDDVRLAIGRVLCKRLGVEV